MSISNNFYSNKLVKKPWGYEYVIYNSLNRMAITYVHIDSKKPIPEDIKAQMESPHYIYSLENDYQLQEAVDNALLKTRK